jgi:hypothetical protein
VVAKTRIPRISGAVSIILVIILLSAAALAQTDSTGAVVVAKTAPHGAWALQIELGNPLSRDNFRTYNFLVKHHYSASTAIRLSVNIGGRISSVDQNTSSSGSNPVYYESEYNDNSQSVSLTALYLKYLPIQNRLRVYWGLGPTCSFSRHKDTRDYDSQGGNINIQEFRNFSAGASTAFGAEFFIMRRLSVTAEYGLTMVYSHVRMKATSKAPNYDPFSSASQTLNEDQFQVNQSSVNFGLSVYF